MEKLKSILTPGKATDDEIMYGSGRSNDPVHSGHTGVLTGEGSHFNNSRDTPGDIGLGSSSVGDAPATAGPHSTDLANKADPRVDSDLDGSRTAGNPTGAYGSTGRSSMPGAFESDSSPYSTQKLDPRLGGPTTAAGVGSGTTGTGYDTTGQQTGYASQRTTGAPESHFGRDTTAAGTAGVVGEGVHHHRENERENLGTSTSASGTRYGDNTGVDNTSSNTTTTGPHSSNILNKLDPRVDSNTSRSKENTGPGPHYGRDAAVVGGAAVVGEGIHSHRENERENLGPSGYSGTTPSGVGSAYHGGPTGTAVSEVSGPHTTSTANRLDPAINQSGRHIEDAHRHDPLTGGGGAATDEAHGGSRNRAGRDAAVGAGGVGIAEHEHRKHERERDAGVGSTTGTGSNTNAYGDNSAYHNTTGTTTGPHESSLLNKIDPRVHSTSGTADNTGSGQHLGRDAVVGAGGVGMAEHEHRKHELDEGKTGVGSTAGTGSNTGAYGDDPAYTGTTGNIGQHHGRDAAVGAGGVGLAEHEHRKLEREREVGVGNSGIGSTAGPFEKDPSYTDTSGTSSHHYVRDGAVGAGGVGLVEHEHRKHEREHESELGSSAGTSAAAISSTGPAPNTAGPHSKDWMNKLDPRVDHNANAGNTGIAGISGTTHEGRDTASGAGLVGATGYEAEKHHAARNEPGVGGIHDENSPNFHHTGRDASAVGAAAALDEDEKNNLGAVRVEYGNNYSQGPVEPGTTVTGPGAHDLGYNPATTGPMHEQSRDHHLGRDTAGAGVVGGAAYEAEKHHGHDKDLTVEEREEKHERKHEEKEAKREHKEEKKHHGLLSFLNRDKNKKYTKEEENEFDRQEREYHSHAGRDAAVGGAAVGGAAYEAEKHHGHHHNISGEPDTMKPLPVAPGNHGIGTGEGTQNALVMDRRRGEGYDMEPTTGTGHPLTAGSEAYQPPGTTIGDKLHGVERNRGINDRTTGAGYGNTTDTTGTGAHHYGRDAAVGAGGVGLAEHEHRKHKEERAAEFDGSYPNTTGTTGTSSGIGYGANDPVTNMLGANTQAERSAGYSGPLATKHNVLHKDPPSGHPAARTMAGEGTYPQDTTGSVTGSGNY